jgi:hypothetical protein
MDSILKDQIWTGFTGFGGSFFACGEAPFGRRPFYPDNLV